MSNSGGEDQGEHPNKRSKKELKQDLRALQAENLRLTEENQRLTGAQVAEAQPPQAEGAQPVNKTEAEDRVLTKIHRKGLAASAGRRAAILHMPFMDDDYLFDHRVHDALPRLIAEIKNASHDPDDPEADADGEPLDDIINPKKWWDRWRMDVPDAIDMVRKILFHLPPGASKWWFKDWFKDSFLEGHRKIRGDIVFHISKNHNLIFGITDTRFRDKKLRVTLRKVQELRKTFQYKYLEATNPKPGDAEDDAEAAEIEADKAEADDPEADDAEADAAETGDPKAGDPKLGKKPKKPKPDPTTLFRHDCIMKTIRYIYSGESAIATGVRSKKARNAHSALWHIEEVTPAVIAFAVTAIDYVLSGEGSFEKSTADSDYFEFFRGRLTMLSRLHERHPRIFEGLIEYLNMVVLPDIHRQPGEGAEVMGVRLERGLSQRDIDFMENM
ncbi:hypothetical protein FRC08_012201 [Ceratobasidium sp. 394]|nr:hypothetical protein FRC08_012201 [Ceratobasidium sp. 394]